MHGSVPHRQRVKADFSLTTGRVDQKWAVELYELLPVGRRDEGTRCVNKRFDEREAPGPHPLVLPLSDHRGRSSEHDWDSVQVAGGGAALRPVEKAPESGGRGLKN